MKDVRQQGGKVVTVGGLTDPQVPVERQRAGDSAKEADQKTGQRVLGIGSRFGGILRGK